MLGRKAMIKSLMAKSCQMVMILIKYRANVILTPSSVRTWSTRRDVKDITLRCLSGTITLRLVFRKPVCSQHACFRLITQGDHQHHLHHLSCGPLLLKSKGHTSRAIASTPLVGLFGRPFQGTGLPVSSNSKQQGPHSRPCQGQGLYSRSCSSMTLSKTPLPYLDQVQGFAPAIQKESFSLTVYSMGVRTIEQSLGVEGKFFNSRTGSFRLTDPECINAVLDLMEAVTPVSRKHGAVLPGAISQSCVIRPCATSLSSSRTTFCNPLAVRLIPPMCGNVFCPMPSSIVHLKSGQKLSALQKWRRQQAAEAKLPQQQQPPAVTAAGAAEQPKGAKGSTLASAAKPTKTAKSKATASSAPMGSGQGVRIPGQEGQEASFATTSK